MYDTITAAPDTTRMSIQGAATGPAMLPSPGALRRAVAAAIALAGAGLAAGAGSGTTRVPFPAPSPLGH